MEEIFLPRRELGIKFRISAGILNSHTQLVGYWNDLRLDVGE